MGSLHATALLCRVCGLAVCLGGSGSAGVAGSSSSDDWLDKIFVNEQVIGTLTEAETGCLGRARSPSVADGLLGQV